MRTDKPLGKMTDFSVKLRLACRQVLNPDILQKGVYHYTSLG